MSESSKAVVGAPEHTTWPADIPSGSIILFDPPDDRPRGITNRLVWRFQRAIMKRTKSVFTHVGVSVNVTDRKITGQRRPVPMIMESTKKAPSPFWRRASPSNRNGPKDNGVQLVSLAERVAKARGAVYACRLSRLPAGCADKDVAGALMVSYEGMKDVGYEMNPFGLLASTKKGFGITQLLGRFGRRWWVFCSEMTAKALREVGILLHAKSDDRYTPASFEAPEKLTLAEGFGYEPPVRIDRKLAVAEFIRELIAAETEDGSVDVVNGRTIMTDSGNVSVLSGGEKRRFGHARYKAASAVIDGFQERTVHQGGRR